VFTLQQFPHFLSFVESESWEEIIFLPSRSGDGDGGGSASLEKIIFSYLLTVLMINLILFCTCTTTFFHHVAYFTFIVIPFYYLGAKWARVIATVLLTPL